MIDIINVPIYDRSVAILVDVTSEEFDRFYYDNVTRMTDEECKAVKKDINGKYYNGSAMLLESNLLLMYVRRGDDHGAVSHEIFHICNMILYDAQVNHDCEAEPWAYLIGWFTDEYYKKYQNWIESKKEDRK